MHSSSSSSLPSKSQPSSSQDYRDDDDHRKEESPKPNGKDTENLGTESRDKPASTIVSEHVKNTLLLLRGVPVPEDDPMSIVPKEADYYEDLSKDGSNAADNMFGDGKLDPSAYYKEARKELDAEWSKVVGEPLSIDQVNIMSALGEVFFREGLHSMAENRYAWALQVLETLVGKDNMRVADLNVKICICLEAIGDANEAIVHCNEATSIYQARLKKLIAESNQSSSVTSDDPVVEKRKLEKRRLTSILSDLVVKLDDLRKRVKGSLVDPCNNIVHYNSF